MRTFVLTLRGLWSRRGVSLAVLLVAAVAVGTATAAPVYLHAGGDSITSAVLDAAPSVGNGVAVVSPVTDPLGIDPVTNLSSRVDGEVPAHLRHLFEPPVLGLQALVPYARGTHSSMLAWRTDQCAHLRISEGRCPTHRNQVLVSRRLASQTRLTVGAVLTVPEALPGQRLRVVGTYVPLDTAGRYWGTTPGTYFPVLQANPPANTPRDDALFTVRPTLINASLEKSPAVQSYDALLDLPLRIGRVRYADIPAVQRGIATILTQENPEFDAGDATSSAAPVLDRALASYDALRLPLLLVVLQLLILCWTVLYFVVAGAVDARGGEIALAKVRGLPPRRTLLFGLGEVLVLLVLAVPLGVVLGVAGTSLLIGRELWPGTPTVLTDLALGAAAVAAVGGAVAALAAAWRTLTRPVLEQWRRGGDVGRARGWAVDTGVLVLTVAGLVELLRTSADPTHPDPLALLAPGLLVLAVALVGSRTVGAVGGLAVLLSRRRGTALYLAGRQVARRPGGGRLVLVLAIAFGLATFGVEANAVAVRNVQSVASVQVGAADVLEVVAPPTTSTVRVLARAGLGHEATVVDSYFDFSEQHTSTLGVDPDAFATVAAWPPGSRPTPARLRRLLHPPAPDPVLLRGGSMRLHLEVSRLHAGGEIGVQATVTSSAGGPAYLVDLGRLPDHGPATLSGRLPHVPGSLTLRSLQLVPIDVGLSAIHATVDLVSVQVRRDGAWRRSTAGFGTAGQWRSMNHDDYEPADRLVPRSGRLLVTLDTPKTAVAGIEMIDTPQPVPALVTADLARQVVRGRLLVTGLDGSPLVVHPVGTPPVLPGYLGPSVVLDRTYGVRAGLGLGGAGQQQVWVAPGHVGEVTRALSRAAVQITGHDTAETTERGLRQQGPLLALVLFAAGAVVAAGLTAAGVTVNLWLTGRRRGYELAALKVVGLRPRTLYLAVLLEQAVLVLVAAVLGAASGVAAAALVLPAVPEFVDPPPSSLLGYAPPVAILGLLFAAVLVLLVLVVAVVSLALLRAARPGLLREAQT